MATYSKETALYENGAIANDITAAAGTANKYITYVDPAHGIRVYDGDSSNEDVNFTQVNSSGMQVYQGGITGENKVASFGAEASIGSSVSGRSLISTRGFKYISADNVQMFDVSPADTTMSDVVQFEEEMPTARVGSPSVYALSRNPDSGSTILCLGFAQMKSSSSSIPDWRTYSVEFDAMTSATKTLKSGSTTIGSLHYASPNEFELTVLNSSVLYADVRIIYDYTLGDADFGALTFGSRRSGIVGTGSAALGVGLVGAGNAQTVIGKYNEEDTDGDYSFIVGGGTSAAPRNLFTVDWSGSVEANEITAERIKVLSGLDADIIPTDRIGTVPANGYVDVSVGYNKAFSKAPAVVIGLYSTSTSSEIGSLSVAVHDISTVGFVARFFNAGSSGRAPAAYWIAVDRGSV